MLRAVKSRADASQTQTGQTATRRLLVLQAAQARWAREISAHQRAESSSTVERRLLGGHVMASLHLLILILSFICFVLATVGVSARVNLTALGLALFVLAGLVP